MCQGTRRFVFVMLMGAFVCDTSTSVIRRSADAQPSPGITSFSEKLPHSISGISSLSGGGPSPHLPSFLKKNAGADSHGGEPKLPLPGPVPIDIEQIKKIAAILSFIGNQILPAILDQKPSEENQNFLK